MKLKDILKDYDHCYIQIRTNYPRFCNLYKSEEELEDGIMFGYCDWDGENLIPEDDDFYSLEWDVTKYEYDEEIGILVVWIESDWS